MIRSLTLDAVSRKLAKTKVKAKSKSMPNKFKASGAAEANFFRALKKVAVYAGHIIEQHVEGAEVKRTTEMMRRLTEYSETIEPWARRQAEKLLQQVNSSNLRAYKRHSQKMATALREDLLPSRVGQDALALITEQVGLIKSIPLEAGLRAQEIATENFISGARFKVDPETVAAVEKKLGLTTEQAVNRARLIARTETARSNAAFVQARAQAIGAVSYIWRTGKDESVRPSHRKMEGKQIFYADGPPLLEDGMRGHAGTLPNCRCIQEPELPDEY